MVRRAVMRNLALAVALALALPACKKGPALAADGVPFDPEARA